ncbi:hypothetical protein ABZY83_34095 [Streptomyces virginiae]
MPRRCGEGAGGNAAQTADHNRCGTSSDLDTSTRIDTSRRLDIENSPSLL